MMPTKIYLSNQAVRSWRYLNHPGCFVAVWLFAFCFLSFFTCSQTEEKKLKIKSVKVSGAVQHLSNPEHSKNKTSYKKRFARIIDVHASFVLFSTFKDETEENKSDSQQKQKVKPVSTFFSFAGRNTPPSPSHTHTPHPTPPPPTLLGHGVLTYPEETEFQSILYIRAA